MQHGQQSQRESLFCKRISVLTDFRKHYRSRRLSFTDLRRGLRRYSISRRFPVLISTVTAMPGERFTCLPSTWIVERSILILVGYTKPTFSMDAASSDTDSTLPGIVP